MARLRAQHIPTQQAGGPGSSLQFPAPFAPGQEVLQGASGQFMGSGHEHLPQGMTLPEGWTVMPLQRQNGATTTAAPQVATSSAVPQPTATQESVYAPAAQSTSDLATSSNLPAATVQQTPNSTGQDTNQPTMPTDERGSPLFVPAVPSENIPAPSSPPSTTQPTPLPPREEAHPHSESATAPLPANAPAQTPWVTNGWSFSDQAANEQPVASSATEQASQPENGSGVAAEESNGATAAPYAGKGKGRAVEVEDASDQDD